MRASKHLKLKVLHRFKLSRYCKNIDLATVAWHTMSSHGPERVRHRHRRRSVTIRYGTVRPRLTLRSHYGDEDAAHTRAVRYGRKVAIFLQYGCEDVAVSPSVQERYFYLSFSKFEVEYAPI